RQATGLKDLEDSLHIRLIQVGRGHRDQLAHYYPSSCLMGLAGTPTATTPGPRSFTTTAPAPTIAHSPTQHPGTTLLPTPISTPRSTRTLPARCTPGARCA